MSKINALAGLIGNYGDSDEESDDGGSKTVTGAVRNGFANEVPPVHSASDASAAAIHPAPIPHCPWSACYDENSGFTYYWNQQTNAVTWEAPPEYLLALKLAQQQMHTAGSTEVSAEEWQLYQQALAEKQNTTAQVVPKPISKAAEVKTPIVPEKNRKTGTKRRNSDDEDEKIELITSYHNSDSESNDEADSPVKGPVTAKPPKIPKPQTKKHKTSKPKEYGPTLPPNQNYTIPIGPEMPPEFKVGTSKEKETNIPPEQVKKTKPPDSEDSQDETLLLSKLKDKAKLLEKLGGEIPVELQKIIQDETNSKPNSPKVPENTKESKSAIDTNIDDLLQEIEKKELPKVVKKKIDMFSDEAKSNDGSLHDSPRSNGVATPPTEELKPLFPSSKNMVDIPSSSLFPSAANIQETDTEKDVKENLAVVEKKGVNLYLADASEVSEKPSRKKLRISNSVLPVKKPELPSYTTKYAQSIDGTTGERTGLGFSKEDEEETTPKNTISYGNGLMFTKGETLNEDKKDDEDLDDLTELLEAKLKYLNQLQPGVISPVQEMMIQMQTLVAAFRAGALSRAYWRRWARGAGAALRRHEALAAPPGWTCVFQRSEGRYRYEREADGLVQWEYPAAANMDMDISTTPPHPGIEAKEEILPPLPPAPPAAPPPPPLPPARPRTPPPPAWADPPPPGCDEPAPPLPPEPKKEIGDELTSFYNDIAELEKTEPPTAPASAPASHGSSPEPKLPDPPLPRSERERSREKERDVKTSTKKKSKVKISSSIGMKHKSVSSLVAKWQQVAEEINSE